MLIPAAAKDKFPEGTAIANGETRTVAGIKVEVVASYDLLPGDPFHPKGRANGYIVTLGGQRVYFAGVSECTPEMKALKNIDVAFVSVYLPNERMTPSRGGRLHEDLQTEGGVPLPLPHREDSAVQGRAEGRANRRAPARVVSRRQGTRRPVARDNHRDHQDHRSSPRARKRFAVIRRFRCAAVGLIAEALLSSPSRCSRPPAVCLNILDPNVFFDGSVRRHAYTHLSARSWRKPMVFSVAARAGVAAVILICAAPGRQPSPRRAASPAS